MNDVEQSTHGEDFQIDWVESHDLGLVCNEDCEESDEYEDVSTKQLPKNKSKKKPGRKAMWSDSLVNDLVDIIANDEYYKKKLIFTNTKNQKNGNIYENILKEIEKRAGERNETVPFTGVQLRTKFKKLVAECKKVALTIKTATGIKRFQEGKGYGQWFNQLYALIKTRDSCQPEQAMEPSASSSSNPELDESTSTSQEGRNAKLFVPVKGQSNKRKKNETLLEVVDVIKKALENDPIKDLVDYMKEDAEKSRQHELMLAQMLMQQPIRQDTFLNQMPHVSQPPVSQPVYVPSDMHTMQSPTQLNGGYARDSMVGSPSFQPGNIQQNSPQGQYFNADNGQHYHGL